MKKILLSVLTFFVAVGLTAQTVYTMDNNSVSVDCSDGGVLYDSGGGTGNYADNESFVMTVCPADAGFGIYLDITSISLGAGDVLCMYDGMSVTDSVILCIPQAGQIDPQAGSVFQSTVNNASGCITIEFNSDGDGDVGDFAFDILCGVRCQEVVSIINFTDPDLAYDSLDGEYYVNICLGDTLFANATAVFPDNDIDYHQSNATSSFEWSWDQSGDAPDIGQGQYHVFDEPGGYFAFLSVYDTLGCRNFQDQSLKVRVAPIPEFLALEDSVLCLGDIDTLRGLPEGDAISGGIVVGETEYFIPPVYTGDTTYIPDGTGSIHTSSAFVTGYEDGSLIENCGDIVEICMQFEHSYSGDLDIILVCPNGQSVTILDGGTGSTNFGEPYATATVDGNTGDPTPGLPYDYCFSSFNNDFNTLDIEAGEYDYTYTTVPSQGGATSTYNDSYFPSGTYLPDENFNSLVGCPINGEWKLTFEDNLGADNGWLFNWELNIDPCMFPDIDSFTVVYDYGYWDAEPTIIGIVNDSNTILIEPDMIGDFQYTYHTENQFGCEYTHEYNVTVLGFEVDATPDDTTVCPGDPVQLNVEVLGTLGGPYTYEWFPATDLDNNSIQNPIATLSTSGLAYSVGVSDDNGCTYYDTIDIQTESLFEFSAMGDTAICFGESVALWASGGAISYAWTPNDGTIDDTTSATPIVTPATTTTYTVKADSTGCSQYANIEVAISNISATILPPTNPTCGSSDGNFYIFGTGGVGPLTYSIDNGATTQTSGIYTNLGAGVYPISISDGTGCDYFDTITLVGGEPLEIDTVILADPACGVIGSINAILTNPALAVTYTLDVGPVSQDSSLFSGLNGGTYTITIDDGVCPSIDTTVTLFGSASVVLSVDSSFNVSCFNAADGKIYLGASGGTTYNYSIDGVNYDNVGVYTNLDTGTYTVYVEESGCIDSSFVTITEPDSLVFSTVIDSIFCFGNTADITITATGGTMPYEYSIEETPVFSAANNYSVSAGSYAIQVQDANNCLSFIELDTIVEPTQVVLSLDSVINAHCGLADGEIYLDITGGSSPYSYTIDAGVNTQDSTSFIGVFADTYLVEVTDNNSCPDTLTVVVQDDATLAISVAAFDSVSCFDAADATVQVSATGGTAPYQFSADGGLTYQLDSVFTNLAGGSHTFMVRDTATCTESVTITVFEPAQLAYSYTTENLSCDESGDGEVLIVLTGGTPPYAYALDDYFSPQLTGGFTSLDAGSYTGYVIDANTCQDTITSINVTQPDTFEITLVAQDIVCNGDNNGIITVTPSGGTTDFEYTLNGTTQSSNVFNALAGGVYTVNATDENGCPASAIDSIFEPTAIVFDLDSQKNVTCFGGNDGYMAFTTTGGTGSYTYSKDNGASFQADSSFNLLTAGTYNVVVKDASGCEENLTVTITETAQIQFSTSSTAVTCAGSTDGIVSVNSVSGGNAPYSVIVNSTAAVSFTGTYSLGGLQGGMNHTVQIIDDEGCTSAVQNVFVDQPDSIRLTEQNVVDVSCNASGDGSVSFIAEEGTPAYTFTLDVNGSLLTQTGSNNALYENLDGGQYQAYVTDVNGCSDSLIVDIVEPIALVVDSVQILQDISCFGEDDATLLVHASGGVQFDSPSNYYLFSWSPSGDTELKAGPLGPGVHTVTVTDANGCTATGSQTIAAVDPILATINPDSAFMSMGDTLQLDVYVENAIGSNLQYAWSPTNGLSCTDCANPSVTIYNDIAYSVIVTDENGCTNYNYSEVYIGINQSLFFFIPNGFTPNGDGVNDVFEVYGQDVKTVEMSIFNRWGEKVFEGTNQFDPWDGTFNGVMQGNGVYTYAIDVTFLNDVTLNKKGSFTLLR